MSLPPLVPRDFPTPKVVVVEKVLCCLRINRVVDGWNDASTIRYEAVQLIVQIRWCFMVDKGLPFIFMHNDYTWNAVFPPGTLTSIRTCVLKEVGRVGIRRISRECATIIMGETLARGWWIGVVVYGSFLCTVQRSARSGGIFFSSPSAFETILMTKPEIIRRFGIELVNGYHW
jgi:hypothetical protein